MKLSDLEYTPPEVYEPVLQSLGLELFGTDPCTSEDTPLPARRRVVLPDDGLSLPWEGVVWCNPPYSAPRKWVERCSQHNAGAVVLINYDATRLWDEVVWPHATICFLRKRVRFLNPIHTQRTSVAVRPSALCFFGLRPSLAVLSTIGNTVNRCLM